jgi:hypothetical protein
MEEGNSEAVGRFPKRELALKIVNISVVCIHINNIELLVKNSKIQKT